MPAVREILIATPSQHVDLYELHQRVWEHASRAARPGVRPAFLYRVEEGVIRARSQHFARGTVREFRAGPCRLDVAAIVQSQEGERAVAADGLDAWVSGKLIQAGLRPKMLKVVSYDLQLGAKRDRETGKIHRISLPVARLELDLEVVDNERALAAWRDGVGRGRRFGLGMLHH